MNVKRGKKINIFPIAIVLILLSIGSSWVSSVVTIPLQMGQALVKGELYAGPIERIVDERGVVSVGITAERTDGDIVFVPAERFDEITQEFFWDTDQAVFMNAEGATFWLTYEDLLLAYAILVLSFLAFRIASFLVLSVFQGLTVIENQTAIHIRKGIHFLIKPMRMLLFGYLLAVFYQYRIFGYEEEAEAFSIFILIYGLYFLFVIVKRLLGIRSYLALHAVNGKIRNSPVNSTASEVIHSPMSTMPTTKHENDLIQRQKRTFKHQTSRYN